MFPIKDSDAKLNYRLISERGAAITKAISEADIPFDRALAIALLEMSALATATHDLPLATCVAAFIDRYEATREKAAKEAIKEVLETVIEGARLSQYDGRPGGDA